MSGNLYEALASVFGTHADRIAIETVGGRCWTYAQLDALTARMAAALASLGAQPGERVAVKVEKSVEALALYLATLRAGCVCLPLNTAYQTTEVSHFLGDAQPSVVVCRPEDAPMVRDAVGEHARVETLDAAGGGSFIDRVRQQLPEFATVARGERDLAAILYTSGTTGRSKGAMLTHRNLTSNARVLVEAWRFTSNDTLLHALPLFHVHGLFVASHCALFSGARMIFLPKFDIGPVMANLSRCTVLMGVPTFYTRLLTEPGLTREAVANVRLFVSGSAPLLAETHREFETRTGQRILERYGMTETGMLTSNPYDGERVAGSVGRALPGTEVRVTDDADRSCAAGEVGNVQVRGANVFSGYWRRPELNASEFTPDGFFRTGDVGSLDARGYLTLVGRSKDLIISGGYNVYPKEVESAIDDMPGVLESAVIGLPHHDFGEAVTAVIVREPGKDGLDEHAVITRLKAQLANYKVPKHVHFVDELPRNAMGKVQKNVLRERFSRFLAGY